MVWPNSNSDTAVFGGADGAYTVTAASGLAVGTMTFNASGYTLAGASTASPGTLAISIFGTGSGQVNVATGKTLTIGANLTVNTNTGCYINYLYSAYAGTLVVNNGGTLNLASANVGGTCNIGANGTVRDANGSTVMASGSTLNIDGANASLTARGLNISSGAVVNVNNGTLNASGAFGFSLNGGTLNLNGGTFVASYVPSNTNTSTIHLNGGLIVNSTSGYGNNFGSSKTTILVQGAARVSLSRRHRRTLWSATVCCTTPPVRRLTEGWLSTAPGP